MKKLVFVFFIFFNSLSAQDDVLIKSIFDTSLTKSKAYEWLDYLSNQIGGRLSGSLEAQRAIEYTKSEKDGYVTLSVKPESTGEITIIGTTVIPEFSMFIPLIMGFMIILTVPAMRKFSLH